MEINALFFGATADAVGKRSVGIELAQGTSAETAVATIIEKFPGLANKKLLFAINQEYVPSGSELKDGDELAIFTAVSGG
jgi:molybdopterin converting factor small subunit